MLKSFASVSLGLALVLIQSSQSVRAETCADALAGVARDQVAQTQGSHFSLWIDRAGTPLLQKSYGTYLGKAVSTDTPFLLGSITKTLMAMTTMRLVKAGSVSISDVGNPGKALPSSWPTFHLVQWLHHTSGIKDYVNDNTLSNGMSASEYLAVPRTDTQVISTFPKTLTFEPEQNLVYSNTNYWLVSTHLQNKFGVSANSLLQSQVATPLSLEATHLADAPSDEFIGDSGLALSNWRGVGNGVSTAADLIRILRALDQDQFLSPDQKSLVFSRDPDCHYVPGTGPEKCGRYGIGFSLRYAPAEQLSSPSGGLDWVLHEGHLNHVSSVIAKVRSLNLNLVLLTDLVDANQETRARAILTRVLAAGCAQD